MLSNASTYRVSRIGWAARLVFIAFLALNPWSSGAAASPRESSDGCNFDFSHLAPSNPTLDKLFDHLNSRWDEDEVLRHQMSVKGGRAHIEIGFLTNKDPEFLSLFSDAMEDGAIADVQMGSIIGPKALNWMVRMNALAPAKSNVDFHGHFTPARLLRAIPDELSWSLKDETRLFDAMKELGVEKACLQHWKTKDISKCGELKFWWDNTGAPPMWSRGTELPE